MKKSNNKETKNQAISIENSTSKTVAKTEKISLITKSQIEKIKQLQNDISSLEIKGLSDEIKNKCKAVKDSIVNTKSTNLQATNRILDLQKIFDDVLNAIIEKQNAKIIKEKQENEKKQDEKKLTKSEISTLNKIALINDMNILTTEKKSIAINELKKMVSENKIDIPKIQRKEVWSDEQKKLLIETVNKNLDIPKIYLARLENDTKFQLIDGQQRLSTFRDFEVKNGDYKVDCTIAIFEKQEDINLYFMLLNNGKTLSNTQKMQATFDSTISEISYELSEKLLKITQLTKNQIDNSNILHLANALILRSSQEHEIDFSTSYVNENVNNCKVNFDKINLYKKSIDKIEIALNNLDIINDKKTNASNLEKLTKSTLTPTFIYSLIQVLASDITEKITIENISKLIDSMAYVEKFKNTINIDGIAYSTTTAKTSSSTVNNVARKKCIEKMLEDVKNKKLETRVA